MMPRRRFLGAVPFLMLAGKECLLAAQEKPVLKLDVSGGVIPAPDDPALWPAFRAALAQWREETRRRLRYSDALYRRGEFAWSASNYACCFLMTCDESFYDRRAGRYRVDAFLDHGRREFGGFDSVVLWHAYPRMGVDQRNQFDFYRDLPGGLPGLRSVVRQFHRRAVRVYIDYNPWDSGTRREKDSDAVALCSMVRQIEADGIFLDTMSEGGDDLLARLEEARRGVILEGEDAVPLEHVCDHLASWARDSADSNVPGVLKHKWFERRHMQHQIRRWDEDHTAELHTAWMNGSGMMIWENVFGSLVLWNQRDRAILRAMLPSNAASANYSSRANGPLWFPSSSRASLPRSGRPGGCAFGRWSIGRRPLARAVSSSIGPRPITGCSISCAESNLPEAPPPRCWAGSFRPAALVVSFPQRRKGWGRTSSG